MMSETTAYNIPHNTGGNTMYLENFRRVKEINTGKDAIWTKFEPKDAGLGGDMLGS